MEPNIKQLENPLKYWERHKFVSPNLCSLALTFLCTPQLSVPCGTVFSKIGGKKNCLSPNTVEKLLFLNKMNKKNLQVTQAQCLSRNQKYYNQECLVKCISRLVSLRRVTSLMTFEASQVQEVV